MADQDLFSTLGKPGSIDIPDGCTPAATFAGDGMLPFDAQEQNQIADLNRSLFAAYGGDGTDKKHKCALRCYLRTMTSLRGRYAMFEIANHRIFKAADSLIVPYDAHGRLAVYAVQKESAQIMKQLRLPHGTLLTDELICGPRGRGHEVIDLEREIYHLKIDDIPAVHVSQLRDLARVLRRLNDCGSRHEAVYLLRFLVARFCSPSYRGIAGAKNLRPEITRVRNELTEFMNGPFANRLRLPTRILVRSISGLVSRPKLIDEVWQDAIDLAEVHVPGSAIANEIRRSTHHALGKQTLALTEAYLQWLQTGKASFPDPDREIPTAADRAARSDKKVLALVTRVVANLRQLLGSSQIATRVFEWRNTYAGELLRCDSSNTLDEELESLVENGIRAGNRWVYQQRLRNLASKARAGAWAAELCESFEDRLKKLQEALPGDADFPAAEMERLARTAVSRFSEGIRRDHQDALFTRLDELLECFVKGEPFETFQRCCRLRHDMEVLAGEGVFVKQRFLLHQLDCVLEELGFLALRHLASSYLEDDLVVEECLSVVFLCAGNLERDGLFSRELWDLSVMLVNPSRTPSELLDVLEDIQRHYHRLVHRVSEAYEVMAEHLGYSADEMRAVLGNFYRTMHDLNSLVHFSDLARTHITQHGDDMPGLGTGAMGDDPWDFVHLSHRDDIKRRVEDWAAPSLQARYGGKGCGLIHIAYLGIPTRDAFVIPTVLPRMNLHNRESRRLDRELIRHVHILENDIELMTGNRLRLGDPDAPLLLAVRGGSVFSMPGMLSTVVFAGMTDAVAEVLARDDEWYAWDAYRRFLVSYAGAVWHLDLEERDLVEKTKRRHDVALKIDLPGKAMRDVVEDSKAAIRDAGHGDELAAILGDVELQLLNAMRAVYASWDAVRARRFRAIKQLSEGWHTAVIVQQMASGNRSNEEQMKPGMDETRISLTGVIPHTRMMATGVRAFTGDVKFSACGDDLVGGLTAAKSFEPVQELHSQAPMLERKLNHISARLRRFLGSDTEIEFTVERGILSILQSRSAQMELHYSPRTFDDPGRAAGRGIGISGGAFRGLVAFDEAGVEALRDSTKHRPGEVDGVLLVLENPIPDEIPLILSVDGLLAARGGSTSHAAVAVHGIDDKPYTAVLGVAELRVYRDKAVLVGPDGEPVFTVHHGDVLSIHGQTGDVFVGSRKIHGIQPEPPAGAAPDSRGE